MHPYLAALRAPFTIEFEGESSFLHTLPNQLITNLQNQIPLEPDPNARVSTKTKTTATPDPYHPESLIHHFSVTFQACPATPYRSEHTQLQIWGHHTLRRRAFLQALIKIFPELRCYTYLLQSTSSLKSYYTLRLEARQLKVGLNSVKDTYGVFYENAPTDSYRFTHFVTTSRNRGQEGIIEPKYVAPYFRPMMPLSFMYPVEGGISYSRAPHDTNHTWAFPTAEHAYQHEKALIAGSQIWLQTFKIPKWEGVLEVMFQKVG